MELNYFVKSNNKYKTVREVLINEFSISSRLLTLLRKEKKIYLNNSNTYLDKELLKRDLVTVNLNFEEDNSNIVPYNYKLNIVYEDDAYIVIDKPAGIAIHPSCLHYDNSLSNAVKFYLDSTHLHVKIRPVNRLDKDTSRLSCICKKSIYTRIFSKTNVK